MKFIVRYLFFVLLLVLPGCSKSTMALRSLLGSGSPTVQTFTSDGRVAYFEIPLAAVKAAASPLRDAVEEKESIVVDRQVLRRKGGNDNHLYTSSDFRMQVTVRVEEEMVKGGVVFSSERGD